MSEKDPGQQRPNSITVGQFEFTSVPLSSIDAKKGANGITSSVLQSVEIQSENGFIPVLVQEEDHHDEPLLSAIPRSEEEEKKARDRFLSKLTEQQSAQKPEATAPKLPEVPASLAELGKYRESTPSSTLPPSINPADNTMLQLVDTIAKLPYDYKQTLLNYLKAVEDKYDHLTPARQTDQQPTH